jgi:hypothetical protein
MCQFDRDRLAICDEIERLLIHAGNENNGVYWHVIMLIKKEVERDLYWEKIGISQSSEVVSHNQEVS